MRFTTTQQEFMDAFNRIAPAVPNKSTLPILSNILLQLEGNRLRMVATDLEVSVLTEIEVKGSEDGDISIPAKKIGDIARELSGMDIEFWVDESFHLQIKAGEGSYQVPGISAQEFPSLPEFEEAAQMKIQSEKLSNIIKRSTFAVSKDELRPALTGVFFQIRPLEIRAVATDGHRLVRIIDQDFSFEGEPREMIIPVKALEMIKRNLPAEGEVQVLLGTSQIMVRLDDATLYSRLIEGKYPHYESVIPQDNDKILKADTADIIRSVKRAQIFSNPISKQIVFHITNNKLEITAEDIELGGRGSEAINVSYEGDDKEMGYNANYILDILKQINTDEVLFELGGSTQAGIVHPSTQNTGEDFLMLIMPVRLN